MKELFQMGITFALATLAWIFFRADNIGQAFSYIEHIFSRSLISAPKGSGAKLIVPLLSIMVIVEWLQRDKQHGLEDLKMHSILRWAIYYTLIAGIISLGVFGQNQFIYFQF